MTYKHWTAFFSQTGSEIVQISQKLGRWPDVICTNKSPKNLIEINETLLVNCFTKILFLPTKPTITEYHTALQDSRESIITLNGWLRVMPEEICNNYTIYNGHPGDIKAHPVLKGFNPQQKAFDLKLKKTGSVIHRVVAEVDAGKIECISKCNIDLTDINNTYKILHENSTKLWVEFLSEKLIISV